MSGQQHAPAALYLQERPSARCTEGWVGPRAGLDGRKNPVPTGIRPRAVQPIVSRYTDRATGHTSKVRYYLKYDRTGLNLLDPELFFFSFSTHCI